jgi:misacylated tRNA(Ala) deacylase
MSEPELFTFRRRHAPASHPRWAFCARTIACYAFAMTTKLYLDDAYCFANEATITALGDSAIALDRTCMYPGGGGQPPDTGSLLLPGGESAPVLSLRRDGDRLWHVCDHLPGVHVGAACSVRLDADRRLRLMRFHTAMHVFNTVMLRGYDGWITGAQMGPERSRIDFRVEYTAEMARRVEDEVNAVIARGLSIDAYTIPADEFRQRPDLLRTLEAEPPIEHDRVRVVEITGFEAQACGGTHVRQTGDVGNVRIVKVDNKGRQNRRFYVELVDG